MRSAGLVVLQLATLASWGWRCWLLLVLRTPKEPTCRSELWPKLWILRRFQPQAIGKNLFAFFACSSGKTADDET